ncbi:DmpA family aminopeptidase [Microbacterium hominis]|uniref:P1 family peptidase n=1 Tax=Microbacterium hominis TaxID=162426 RepID=A0A7D4Q6P6_9MICO|nr:P1 family peptidase [Microbacterium hominis]QKJ18419.1 P1 family peptidase [Microbacterium hominis]
MSETRPRARDLGIPLDGTPGPHNALTDVPGVEIGYTTLIDGEPGAERVARTGVTAILPRGRAGAGIPCAAGTSSFNGNGEMTGRAWIDEAGSFSTPIAITNSHAVGAVHRGVDQWMDRHHPEISAQWMLPVVAETWDGYLNQINGDHVTSGHAIAALDAARSGPVAEGNVGGGTGMNCYSFKGGSGTSSRVVPYGDSSYVVGAFVQANFGSREELSVAGRRLGPDSAAPAPIEDIAWFLRDGERARSVPGAGSVIVVIGTDAPLLPGQCAALARRVPLGLARTGTTGSHFSGDIFLAFSTANTGALVSRMDEARELDSLSFVPWGRIDPFYTATVQAVEEAVLNALVAAEDMAGREDHVSYALPHDEVRAAFRTAVPAGAAALADSAA